MSVTQYANHLALLAFFIGWMALAQSGRATTILIDNDTTGYNHASLIAAAGQNTVGDGYRYGSGLAVGTTASSWNPTVIAGFVSGAEYIVQVDWGVYSSHGNHTFLTTHAAGTSSVNVNMNRYAAQATDLGALPDGTPSGITDNDASGWYTLGRFTLNGSSIVHLKSNNASSGSNYFSSDAVRFSPVKGGEGQIIDETSAGTVYAGTWASSGRVNTTAAQSNLYRVSTSAASADSVSYLVGSSLYTGSQRVAISWGVDAAYSNSAQYVLDLDGNFSGAEDQTTVVIDQRLMANQLTAGTNTWSGWYWLPGQHLLTASSRVMLTDQDTSRILSADALLVVPEPSSLAILAMGLVAIIGANRRSRTCVVCR